MEFLAALSKATAMGISRDVFIRIWTTEMAEKERRFKAEVSRSRGDPACQNVAQLERTDEKLWNRLSEHTKDVQELKLEAGELKKEIMSLSSNVATQTNEILETVLQSHKTVEKTAEEILLVKSQLGFLKAEVLSNRKEAENKFNLEICQLKQEITKLQKQLHDTERAGVLPSQTVKTSPGTIKTEREMFQSLLPNIHHLDRSHSAQNPNETQQTSEATGLHLAPSKTQQTSEATGLHVAPSKTQQTSEATGFHVTPSKTQQTSEATGFHVAPSKTQQTSEATGLHVAPSKTQQTSEATGLHVAPSKTQQTSEATGLHVAPSKTQQTSEATGLHVAPSKTQQTSEATGLHVAPSKTQQTSEATGLHVAPSKTQQTSEATGLHVAPSDTTKLLNTFSAVWMFNVLTGRRQQSQALEPLNWPLCLRVGGWIDDTDKLNLNACVSSKKLSTVTLKQPLRLDMFVRVRNSTATMTIMGEIKLFLESFCIPRDIPLTLYTFDKRIVPRTITLTSLISDCFLKGSEIAVEIRILVYEMGLRTGVGSKELSLGEIKDRLNDTSQILQEVGNQVDIKRDELFHVKTTSQHSPDPRCPIARQDHGLVKSSTDANTANLIRQVCELGTPTGTNTANLIRQVCELGTPTGTNTANLIRQVCELGTPTGTNTAELPFMAKNIWAFFQIKENQKLQPGKEYFTPSFRLPNVPCQVRIKLWFSKNKQLNVRILISTNQTGPQISSPVNLSGSGWIKNNSNYSKIWRVEATDLVLPSPGLEAELEPQVYLKTNKYTYLNISYDKLQAMGYEHNGWLQFKWSMTTDQTSEK